MAKTAAKSRASDKPAPKPGSKTRAQPATKPRAKPGTKGGGRFFHIELRPSGQFVSFRVQDVGGPGGVERVAGRHADGSWETAKWLIEKTHAHRADGKLVADSLEAEKLLETLGSAPVHIAGDRFWAKPRAKRGSKRATARGTKARNKA